jgi:2-amino-4-hydroxy-6-hydroxymethyldihydropteridine diphosphokinase
VIGPSTLVIGLGGNVGSPSEIVDRFRRARASFERIGETRSAALYRTAAIGMAQPAFLNSALALDCSEDLPAALIASVLDLERSLGRDRGTETRGGPRKIDLDVLVWGQRIVNRDDLVVPHPRLASRRFALAPLADLVGEAQDLPGLATPMRELLERVADQRIELVAASW